MERQGNLVGLAKLDLGPGFTLLLIMTQEEPIQHYKGCWSFYMHCCLMWIP